MSDQDLAMQHHCIHCGREQYAPAVAAISCGEAACPWCRELSRRMTVAEYRQAMEVTWPFILFGGVVVLGLLGGLGYLIETAVGIWRYWRETRRDASATTRQPPPHRR